MFFKKNLFFKRLRINPLYFYWKKQILIFSFFLFFIFLSSFFYFFIKNGYNFYQSVEKFLINTNFQEKIIVSDLKENLNLLLKKTEHLPNNQTYSYLGKIKNNLIILKSDLPELEKNLNEFQDLCINYFDLNQCLKNLKKNQGFYFNFWDNLDNIYQTTAKLPININKITKKIFEKYPNLKIILNNKDLLQTNILEILGEKTPHKIIVWLQNSNEPRSTGGFIGSIAEITFNNWELKNFSIKDIYDYDGQILPQTKNIPLLAKKLVPKTGLSLRDSNYSPDLEESANSFINFYEKAGGVTPDTIIAINSSLVENFIKENGGFYLKDLDLEVNEKNFSFILSYFIEGKIKEKDFILNEFLTNLKKYSAKDILQFLLKNKRKIQAYSINKNLNLFFKNFLLNNNLILKDEDVIGVNRISISGNKSSGYVLLKNKLFLENKNHILEIYRKHNWSLKEENLFKKLNKKFQPKIPKEELKKILGAGFNNTIYQFFLPQDAKQIKVYPKNGKLESFNFKNKKVIEYQTPILKPQEEQFIRLYFNSKSENLDYYYFSPIKTIN
jgi:hypothetical protein